MAKVQFVRIEIINWQKTNRDIYILDSQIRNLTADLEQTREQLEEEQEGKAEFQRQVAKLQAEVHQWRSRYESEGT